MTGSALARILRPTMAATVGLLVIGAGTQASVAQPPLPAGGAFHALTPARVLDTGVGLGAPASPVAAGGIVALHVLGRGGIPATGVSAVALHLTVTGPTSAGYVTAWPAGTSRPNASALNFNAGRTVANSVFVTVGVGGVVDLYNGSGGTARFIADVAGYFDTIGGDGRGAYGTLTPARLLDTRAGIGAPAGAVAPGGTIHVAIVGHGGVPAVNNGFGFAAVALNVTAVTPAAGGYVTVWADGTPRPGSSNLNITAGQTVANLAVAALGSGGGVDIYNGSPTPLQFLGDVSGYFSGGAPNAANQFANFGPRRVLDTRSGVGAPAHPVPAGAIISVQIGTGVPLSAVVLNIAVTAPGTSGYLTAWPHGIARPGTSSLNFVGGQTVASLNVVGVGSGGRVDIYNGSGGTVQIIADESGYVTGCC